MIVRACFISGQTVFSLIDNKCIFHSHEIKQAVKKKCKLSEAFQIKGSKTEEDEITSCMIPFNHLFPEFC